MDCARARSQLSFVKHQLCRDEKRNMNRDDVSCQCEHEDDDVGTIRNNQLRKQKRRYILARKYSIRISPYSHGKRQNQTITKHKRQDQRTVLIEQQTSNKQPDLTHLSYRRKKSETATGIATTAATSSILLSIG